MSEHPRWSEDHCPNSIRRALAIVVVVLLAALGLTQAGASTLEVTGFVPDIFIFDGPTPTSSPSP